MLPMPITELCIRRPALFGTYCIKFKRTSMGKQRVLVNDKFNCFINFFIENICNTKAHASWRIILPRVGSFTKIKTSSKIIRIYLPLGAEYSHTDFWVETKWELGGGIMMGFTQTC